VTYNLEFKLPSISEHLHLPINPEALDICSSKEAPAKVPILHEAAAHSKVHQAPLRPKKKRKHIKWTAEEDATVLKMREEDGCSWEEIHDALPHRTPGTIQAHCYAIRAGVGEVKDFQKLQLQLRQGASCIVLEQHHQLYEIAFPSLLIVHPLPMPYKEKIASS
jgi:hypothetical protein